MSMSSPSSPIDLLQYLSLNPQMNPTAEEIRLRVSTIKDILSSFDRHEFPSELKSDISANLDRPPSTRQQQSEWTIQSDLTGTLLQWAVYDDQAYEFLQRIQPPRLLARCFHEKLSRRFGRIFEAYDLLAEASNIAQDTLDELNDLATDVFHIALAVQEDCKHRKIGQEQTAKICLDALIGICQRDDDLVFARAMPRRTQKQARSDPFDGVSLFKIVIQSQASGRSGFFMILEVFDSYPAKVLSTIQPNLQELKTLLETNEAPDVFLARADHLLSRAKAPLPTERSPTEPGSTEGAISTTTRSSSRAQTVPPVAAAATTTTSGSITRVVDPAEESTETAARTGSKRQAAQQGSSKRSKKGPTKK